ncbi:MAG: Helix-turn-helix domain [Xanthobacteraceae bacterium]|jgi:hypothetical protein|nr:Helix-turn-helix domain [Xanthobacteraceae bacterium]
MPKKHDREPGQVYGYVLVLRVLAAGACCLGRYPAALRVLCIIAEYSDKDGKCHVGLDTIGARLGISRQAVAKHVKLLAERDLLTFKARAGSTHKFQIGMMDIEGRFNEEAVYGRREGNRVEKLRRQGVPLCRFREREGFPEYAKFENEIRIVPQHKKQQALAAMKAHEASLGIVYEHVGAGRDGLEYYRMLQLQKLRAVEP